jgi:murein DD-endopeptidase MepM/ murein hydrolase activator NlpD
MRISPLLSVALVSACSVGDQTPWSGQELQTVDDPVVGVSLRVPVDWAVEPDPALFETHGFLLHPPTAEAAARIALAYDATDVEAVVAAKLEQYADVSPQRFEVMLADGVTGVAITGLPGTEPYSVVFAGDGTRVYEIGLWSEAAGIDERGHAVLGELRFRAPTETIESRNLVRADDALYAEPSTTSLAASAKRRAAFERAAAADPGLLRAATAEIDEAPLLRAGGCGFTAPSSLYWQLQWDETNVFYGSAGWSAMSGNYGSWWGTNFHIWACSPYYLNQYYANDWPAQYWANAYAAFSGYVEWAGWGTDGFASLGRYVVVRNGQYRSLTAHLTAIASGVSWGTWINGYWKVIGWAGDTGEYYAYDDWAPHLHARVGWGESLTYNGQPYGGESVAPLALRCFECTDADESAGAGAGGWYTSFWHGRWMEY